MIIQPRSILVHMFFNSSSSSRWWKEISHWTKTRWCLQHWAGTPQSVNYVPQLKMESVGTNSQWILQPSSRVVLWLKTSHLVIHHPFSSLKACNSSNNSTANRLEIMVTSSNPTKCTGLRTSSQRTRLTPWMPNTTRTQAVKLWTNPWWRLQPSKAQAGLESVGVDPISLESKCSST